MNVRRPTKFEDIKKQAGKTFAAILKKQCDMIKVNVKTFRFKDGWQSSKVWTLEQQEKFRTWFINYLYNHLKRTGEIAKFPRITCRSKKRLGDLWQWWNLDYGWKVEVK